MKIQIDLKSAAIGLLIGAAAMFTLGDATQPSDNGRYQCSTAMDASGNAAAYFIVDTRTGQAWAVTQSPQIRHDDGDKFWTAKNQ